MSIEKFPITQNDLDGYVRVIEHMKSLSNNNRVTLNVQKHIHNVTIQNTTYPLDNDEVGHVIGSETPYLVTQRIANLNCSEGEQIKLDDFTKVINNFKQI